MQSGSPPASTLCLLPARVCGSGALLPACLPAWTLEQYSIRNDFYIVSISYAARTSEHEHEPALRWLNKRSRKITTFAVLHMRWHPTALPHLVGPSDATQVPIKSSCIIVQSTSSTQHPLPLLLRHVCFTFPRLAFRPSPLFRALHRLAKCGI